VELLSLKNSTFQMLAATVVGLRDRSQMDAEAHKSQEELKNRARLQTASLKQ